MESFKIIVPTFCDLFSTKKDHKCYQLDFDDGDPIFTNSGTAHLAAAAVNREVGKRTDLI